MAAGGHIPSLFEGRSVPPPGMMRHGPFPGLGPVVPRSLDLLPPSGLVENKMAVQAAEMERLARENQRLAATHVTFRQDLVASQKELQGIQAHMSTVQAESDLHIRGLLERISKMEADLRAGEGLKTDLQEAHLEAQSLITTRQELNTQIQQTMQELQIVQAEIKQMPTLLAELNGLRQEHQRLRVAFEYEKGANMEQLQQMHAMEQNLVSMAREVEKLRAEVSNAEKRARAPNPYGGSYGSHDPAYSSVGQVGYADGFGRSQVQMVGATGEGINPYGAGAGGSSGVGAALAAAAASGGGGNVSGTGGGWGGVYDAVRGAQLHGQR